MNKFFKTVVLAAAVTATTLTTSGLAEARDRHHHHNNNNNAAWAAGAAGLVTGVIVGGAIANSRPAYYYDDGYYAPRRVYVEPEYRPVRRVYRPRPVYVGGYEPWSPEWYSYCGDTYRSFNPRTGTFRGYDGLEHFCVAG